jgi:hypothetical protein
MMGAQASKEQLTKILSYLDLGKQEGAELLAGGAQAHLGGDLDAGYYAEELTFGPIVAYNKHMRDTKHKQYKPRIIRVVGNHEQRMSKFIKKNPKLEGMFGMYDYGYSDLKEKLDMEFIPFLMPINIDGIMYSHYFTSGVMGRPITGAHLLLKKNMMSCTAGHLHLRDWAEDVRADGVRVQGLISGAFHDPDHVSTYSDHQSSSRWWNGVHIKTGVHDGTYDRTEISVERLLRMYGGSSIYV